MYDKMNSYRVFSKTNTYSNDHEYERGRYEEQRNDNISSHLPAYHYHSTKQSEVSANIHCEENSYSHESWQNNRVTERKSKPSYMYEHNRSNQQSYHRHSGNPTNSKYYHDAPSVNNSLDKINSSVSFLQTQGYCSFNDIKHAGSGLCVFHSGECANQHTSRSHLLPEASTVNHVQNTSYNINRNFAAKELICQYAVEILSETATHCLKSVELANALRERIGDSTLSVAKTAYGGLLILLELFPQTFQVMRSPQNDRVKLCEQSSLQLMGNVINNRNQSSMSDINNNSNNKPNAFHSELCSTSVWRDAIDQKGPKSFANSADGYCFNTPFSNMSKLCIQMANIPFNVFDEELWSEFGGSGVVEKVIIDYSGGKRSVSIRFLSPEMARQAFAFFLSSRYSGFMQLTAIETPSSNRSSLLPANKPLTINRTTSDDQLNVIADVTAKENDISPAWNLFTCMCYDCTTDDRSFGSSYAHIEASYENDNVLRMLCDAHFVPGKVWPKDMTADKKYCQLILQIIQSLGGKSTIIKLKHSLKKYFNKSIRIGPLKSLLLAYSFYFQVYDKINVVRALIEPALLTVEGHYK